MEAEIIRRLIVIEHKLDQALAKPKSDIIGAKEAMVLTGCTSVPAQYRWFRVHKVKPYAFGKYRRLDVANRVAMLAIAANTPAYA